MDLIHLSINAALKLTLVLRVKTIAVTIAVVIKNKKMINHIGGQPVCGKKTTATIK